MRGSRRRFRSFAWSNIVPITISSPSNPIQASEHLRRAILTQCHDMADRPCLDRLPHGRRNVHREVPPVVASDEQAYPPATSRRARSKRWSAAFASSRSKLGRRVRDEVDVERADALLEDAPHRLAEVGHDPHQGQPGEPLGRTAPS